MVSGWWLVAGGWLAGCASGYFLCLLTHFLDRLAGRWDGGAFGSSLNDRERSSTGEIG